MYSLVLSFQDWNGLGDPEWVGLANYERLIGDQTFWLSIRNTLIIFVLSTFPMLVIALGMGAPGLAPGGVDREVRRLFQARDALAAEIGEQLGEAGQAVAFGVATGRGCGHVATAFEFLQGFHR